MDVVKLSDITPYEAPGHHGMVASTLQGKSATPNEHFWVGLSIFLPGGGADRAASATEKVYVVLSGEVTVITETKTVTLAATDSCRIAAGEARSIENRSKDAARMIVISANAEPGDKT